MNWHHQIIKTSSAHIFLLCLFVVSFCVSSNAGKAVVAHRKNITCIGQERDALLKFKHHIQTDDCGLMSSWGNPKTPDCCTWNGVSCSNQSGHVIGLKLSGAPPYQRYCLYSQVSSPFLGELKHLKYLDLSSNYFEDMAIPTSIGSLVNLIHLNLSWSNFGGNIPNHLENLTSLTSLDLSYNYRLSALSLNWLSQLTLLRDINFSGTNLSDATGWSQSIGSLPLLEVLKMDGCELSTPLTTSSLLSTNLRIVSLSGNYFSSPSVFQWLFNTSSYSSHKQSLEYLDMSGNFIQGPIPDAIGNAEFLKYLDLSGNSLSSKIPDAIGDLKYLEYLDLSGNSLSSKIPDAIGNLQSLIHMDLSNNSLSGSIPSTLGVSGASGMYSLLYLDLSHNHLEDAIPNAIGNIQSLEHMDLSYNSLSDAIPNAMWNCQSISYIDLSNNQLQGSIPSSLGELSSLSYLDLSNNHLEDTIPSSMVNLDYLEYLDLSCNNLRGDIPCQIGSKRVLAYLNLSYNNLSGYIPKYYMRDLSFDPIEVFQGNPSLHTEFKGTCGEASILSDEQVEGDDENNKDKIYPGLYVSIGLGFYTGFWAFCGTLTLKNSWRHAYFRFLDRIIDNIYVTVAVFLARFRRNSHE